MADLIAIGYPDETAAEPDAVGAMSKFGGTVLKTSLSRQDEQELQEARHGQHATV